MIIQVRWLLKLSDMPEVTEVPKFSLDARTFLETIILEFRENNMHAVMENMEHIANPDVRGVLNFLREKCKDQSEISKVLQNYQGTCTPETFLTAYKLMIKDAVHGVMYPLMTDLCKTFSTLTEEDNADNQVTYTPQMLLRAFEIIVKDATLSPLMPDLCNTLSTLYNTYTPEMLLTAYEMIVKDATDSPISSKLCKILPTLAKDNKEVSMLSKTHDQGQFSKPSIGKELALFFDKLRKQDLASLAEQLSKIYKQYGQYHTELLMSMVDLKKILDDFNQIVIKGRTIESELSLPRMLKA
ncbi:uncharacterized protein LOC144544094 [Carex rostrata]